MVNAPHIKARTRINAQKRKTRPRWRPGFAISADDGA
jgi:hypothetical protein